MPELDAHQRSAGPRILNAPPDLEPAGGGQDLCMDQGQSVPCADLAQVEDFYIVEAAALAEQELGQQSVDSIGVEIDQFCAQYPQACGWNDDTKSEWGPRAGGSSCGQQRPCTEEALEALMAVSAYGVSVGHAWREISRYPQVGGVILIPGSHLALFIAGIATAAAAMWYYIGKYNDCKERLRRPPGGPVATNSLRSAGWSMVTALWPSDVGHQLQLPNSCPALPSNTRSCRGARVAGH